MTETLRQARLEHPEREVELWVQDEGRIGLKPELRRVWAPRGQRPVILQKRGYRWVYVYVFIEPRTGQSDFLILPTVSVALMQQALELFMRKVNPDHNKTIVLVLDGAGWHTSKKLQVPPGLILVHLPPYTPELSPAEPLVRDLKAPISNQTLTQIEEVERLLADACIRKAADPAALRSLCLFPWIKDVLDSL